MITVIYNSVASDYEDVIAMIPTIKIDSAKINSLFIMVLDSITPVGYNVVAYLLDGHFPQI